MNEKKILCCEKRKQWIDDFMIVDLEKVEMSSILRYIYNMFLLLFEYKVCYSIISCSILSGYIIRLIFFIFIFIIF